MSPSDKQRSRRRELALWFKELKRGLFCSVCGEDHPATLDFDHRDGADKVVDLSHMVHFKWSKKKIMLEIAKCDVLCSNCHRKRHWKE